jgi:hypothetical protein
MRANCGKAVSKLCLLAAIAPSSIFLVIEEASP